jgi:hypothetical protein
VRTLVLAAGLAAIWGTTGCKKVGEGEYEVKRPEVGTKTDTVRTPNVETGTVKDTITVPKVTTEKKEVDVPTAKITPRNDRQP